MKSGPKRLYQHSISASWSRFSAFMISGSLCYDKGFAVSCGSTVSSRAALLLSFACFQRDLSLPSCPGIIVTWGVVFPQVCGSATALYFSYTHIPICFFFFLTPHNIPAGEHMLDARALLCGAAIWQTSPASLWRGVMYLNKCSGPSSAGFHCPRLPRLSAAPH